MDQQATGGPAVTADLEIAAFLWKWQTEQRPEGRSAGSAGLGGDLGLCEKAFVHLWETPSLPNLFSALHPPQFRLGL